MSSFVESLTGNKVQLGASFAFNHQHHSLSLRCLCRQVIVSRSQGATEAILTLSLRGRGCVVSWINCSVMLDQLIQESTTVLGSC